MELEINGIKYKKRESPKLSKGVTKLVMMATMFGGLKFGDSKLDDIDVVEEFKLIQDKKSTLSRAQRDSVIYQFNRNYIKVEE